MSFGDGKAIVVSFGDGKAIAMSFGHAKRLSCHLVMQSDCRVIWRCKA